MRNPENMEVFELTSNIISTGQILGMKQRNVIEGGIMTYIAIRIIGNIPFIFKVKVVLWILVSIALMIFNIRGIKGCALTEILIAEIRFRKNKRELHLRGPEYVKEKKSSYGSNYSEKSIAEEVIDWGRGHLDRFLKENSEK